MTNIRIGSIVAVAAAATIALAGCNSSDDSANTTTTATTATTPTAVERTAAALPNDFDTAVRQAGGFKGIDVDSYAQAICSQFDTGDTLESVTTYVQHRLTADTTYNKFPNMEVPSAPATLLVGVSANYYCPEHASKAN